MTYQKPSRYVDIYEDDQFKVRGLRADWQTRSYKTKVSVDIPQELRDAELGEHPPYSIIGEDPENDKAWKAYNRAEVKQFRKYLAMANEEGGFLEEGTKLTFSKTAGCSCGCSPAFKADREVYAPEAEPGMLRRLEWLWVEVKK